MATKEIMAKTWRGSLFQGKCHVFRVKSVLWIRFYMKLINWYIKNKLNINNFTNIDNIFYQLIYYVIPYRHCRGSGVCQAKGQVPAHPPWSPIWPTRHQLRGHSRTSSDLCQDTAEEGWSKQLHRLCSGGLPGQFLKDLWGLKLELNTQKGTKNNLIDFDQITERFIVLCKNMFKRELKIPF